MDYKPLTGPISEDSFGYLAFTSLTIGFFLLALFFLIGELLGKNNKATLAFNKFIISIAASLLLGFGVVFSFLWGGIFL